jgi:hypothetical protein
MAAPTLADLLINDDDTMTTFEALPPGVDRTLNATILTKLEAAKDVLRAPYIIPEGRPVFITSDVHSDLEKLMLLLFNMNIIDSYYTTNPNDAASPYYRNYQKPGDIDHIISLLTNFDIILPEPFIFIIVGDIVDGARYDRDLYHEVHDEIGNLEILLHIFLYNLKIKARLHGSDFRFTIGNHDWHTVITDSLDYGMCGAYVHNSARNYFGSEIIRRNCLLPFYEVTPYLITCVSDEVVCVHGGLHRNGMYGEPAIVNLTDSLIDIQQRLDASDILTIVNNIADKAYLSTSGIPTSPLWTRFYKDYSRAAACQPTRFKMVVVGHCPTDGQAAGNGYMRELLGEQRYAGCDAGGCVLVGCERAHGPTLAFVDISMSRAFRSGYPNDTGRRGDVLLLTHIPDPPNTRFYNRVFRINGGSTPPDIIQIYPPTAQSPDPGLPPLAGGRRKKTKKNRKRTRSSRKVLRNR